MHVYMCVLVCFVVTLLSFICFVCFLCTDMATDSPPLQIGVVGFGHLGLNSPFKSQQTLFKSLYIISWQHVFNLGQYLVEKILKNGPALGLTLGFVWNRNSDKLSGFVPSEFILGDLSSFAERLKHTQALKSCGHTAWCVISALLWACDFLCFIIFLIKF